MSAAAVQAKAPITPDTPWYELSDASPTKAATDLFNTMAAAGLDVINCGQGREIDEPKGKRGRLMSGRVKVSSKYNSSIGGIPTLKKSAAGYANRFLFGRGENTIATEKNTFVIQGLGRSVLDILAVAVKNYQKDQIKSGKKKPSRMEDRAALNGSQGWPMIKDFLDDHDLKSVLYDMKAEDIAAVTLEAIKKSGKKTDFFFDIINGINNATGRHLTEDEQLKIAKICKEHGIPVIHDMPYFHAANHNDRTNKPDAPYLNTGLTAKVLKNSGIYGVALPFTKSDSSAEGGFTIVVVHDELVKYFNGRAARTNGLAFSNEYETNMAIALTEEFDQAALRHYSKLSRKYRTNRQSALRQFSKYEGFVVLGDLPLDRSQMMLSLLDPSKLPKSIFGQEVLCRDSQTRYIRPLEKGGMHDVIEFIANEVGVVLVDNEDGYLRIAQSAHAMNFRQALKRIDHGLDLLMQGGHNPQNEVALAQ